MSDVQSAMEDQLEEALNEIIELKDRIESLEDELKEKNGEFSRDNIRTPGRNRKNLR